MNNFNTQKLLDYAYTLAKLEFGKQTFTFNNLWSKLWKQTQELKKESVKDWIGDFYLELIQDPRFINCGTNTWTLQEFISFEEVKKIKNTMFIIPAEEILEEGVEELGEFLERQEDLESEENEDLSLSEDFDGPKNKEII